MLQWAALCRQRQERRISSADASCGCSHLSTEAERKDSSSLVFYQLEMSQWLSPQSPKPIQHSKISISQQSSFGNWWELRLRAEALCLCQRRDLDKKHLWTEPKLNAQTPWPYSTEFQVLFTNLYSVLQSIKFTMVHREPSCIMGLGVLSPSPFPDR